MFEAQNKGLCSQSQQAGQGESIGGRSLREWSHIGYGPGNHVSTLNLTEMGGIRRL